MPSEGSESEGSDIQIQSALPKMAQKKLPNSPSDDLLKKRGDKKFSTKVMILQSLTELKTRKGVSLYAIKKYIAAKYNVDTDKLKYRTRIKKFIKSAIEKGTIVQTTGIGVKGSFKLAPIKEKKPKTKNPKKEKTEKAKDPEKKKKLKEKIKKTEEKNVKSKVKSKDSKEGKPIKSKKKVDAEKKPKENEDDGKKTKKVRIPKDMQTPSKKKTTKNRKSIASIIKPPKMKPSSKT